VIVAPGQGHDGRVLPDVLAGIRVPRPGPGRPRTTARAVLADKACSSRASRALLRSRGIQAVIPEPSAHGAGGSLIHVWVCPRSGTNLAPWTSPVTESIAAATPLRGCGPPTHVR